MIGSNKSMDASKFRLDNCMDFWLNTFLISFMYQKIIYLLISKTHWSKDHLQSTLSTFVNIELRMVITVNIIKFVFTVFLIIIFTAIVSESAHSPYKRLNTIMVSRSLTFSDKLNVLNLIERLGGSDIAIYCADFFPINMFTFYLLIADIVKNYLFALDTLNTL